MRVMRNMWRWVLSKGEHLYTPLLITVASLAWFVIVHGLLALWAFYLKDSLDYVQEKCKWLELKMLGAATQVVGFFRKDALGPLKWYIDNRNGDVVLSIFLFVITLILLKLLWTLGLFVSNKWKSRKGNTMAQQGPPQGNQQPQQQPAAANPPAQQPPAATPPQQPAAQPPQQPPANPPNPRIPGQQAGTNPPRVVAPPQPGVQPTHVTNNYYYGAAPGQPVVAPVAQQPPAPQAPQAAQPAGNVATQPAAARPAAASSGVNNMPTWAKYLLIAVTAIVVFNYMRGGSIKDLNPFGPGQTYLGGGSYTLPNGTCVETLPTTGIIKHRNYRSC